MKVRIRARTRSEHSSPLSDSDSIGQQLIVKTYLLSYCFAIDSPSQLIINSTVRFVRHSLIQSILLAS